MVSCISRTRDFGPKLKQKVPLIHKSLRYSYSYSYCYQYDSRTLSIYSSGFPLSTFIVDEVCKFGNCEEELPKKPVGRLSVNCRPSVDRQVTDSLPTANQQVTDRLRKKKNCGKHEQLTWHNIP